MRDWTIEVNERDLRVILAAFDNCREGTALHAEAVQWWNETKYVDRLYHRLREHGLTSEASVGV